MEKEEGKKIEGNNKLGFFRRLYLAITDFRIYPFTQREKTSKAVLYFLKLLVLISIILACYSTYQIVNSVNEFLINYDERVADFKIENGILTTDKIIKEKYQDEFLLYVNSSVSSTEFLNSESSSILNDYDFYVLLNSDSVMCGNGKTNTKFEFSLIEEVITKETVRNYLTTVSNNIPIKTVIFITLFSAFFIMYIMKKIFDILLAILVAYIIGILFGVRLKFSGYSKIVMYALTLPILLEVTALVVVGYIPEYVSLGYSLLEYVYIFYAIRAIKLDAIIMNIPGGNVKDKVEQVIEKISKDIEKNIDEQVKEDEEDKDDEDKKE